MIGYDGFITPDGGFYKVRKIGSTGIKHEDFAYAFLTSQNVAVESNIMAFIELFYQRGFYVYSANYDLLPSIGVEDGTTKIQKELIAYLNKENQKLIEELGRKL